MTARNAGSAFVKIRPDAKDFVRDLRRDLATVKDPGLTVQIRADTAQVTADLARFRQQQKDRHLYLGVDMALAQADADMKAFRARQEANGLTLTVDADTGKAERELASLRRQISGIGDLGAALRITGGAAGIAGLPAAALGLAQVAAALQQVTQAGLALPGVFAAAGASIGTLVVGLSGISDAYEAVSQAAESSARDGVRASNQMRNAVVDEASARRDVARATRDARQELQDLNVEMRGGLVNESRAILEAQKAREDLARGNYSDVRDAQLRVVEADQRLLEVRTRNQEVAEKLADTNAKGIANSDQVVAANERLTRAQQAVAETADGVSAAQQKANDAMAKLSPKARDMVNTLIGLKPVAQDLRNSLADIGLDGLSTKLEETVHTLMPTLKDGLGGIARGWNENFKQLFTSIGSDSSKGLIDRILGNTGDAQSRLTAAIDPLVHGVEVLSAAGTDSLPRMADAIGDVAKRFDNFISEADKDGRLQKWIDEGMTAFGHLGETVINLGKTWTAITKASGGGALLSTIESLTNRLQLFLNSTDGQDKLRRFFDEGRDMLDQWRPILEALPGLFEGVYGGAKTYIGGVLDVMGPLVKLLSDHPQLVSTAIAAWAGWKAVGPIVGGVQSTLGGLSTMVTNLGTGFASTRDSAKKAMSEVDDAFVKAGRPSGSGLAKFGGALSALGGASGPLMAITTAAIPALMGAIDKLNEKHEEASRIALQFEKDERTLEATLDRVTGKVTQATRDQAIATARDYHPDGPGAGIDGITKGNALAAAKSLGIAPDVYADALVGKPEAVAQVRDILTKNNLIPELNANAALGQRFTDIRGATNNKLTNDDIINALLGDQAAVDKYGQAFDGTGIEYRSGDYSLAAIAQMLSPTGRASVLSGGALNRSLAALPGATAGAIEANQANHGQWRLNAAGKSFFGGDLQVGASGSDFQVVVPAAEALAMRGKLDQSGLKATPNQDGSITVSVPLNSPYVEKYAKGGATPSGSGPLPGGGFPAVVHPNEWWLNPRGRAVLGDEFLAAANMGKVDIGKLPKFDDGGLVDEYGNPVTAGGMPGPAAGPISSPVAPNPTASGGIGGIFGKVLSGIQGPIGNAISLGTGLMNSLGSPAGSGGGDGAAAAVDPMQVFAGRASQVPGLVGLFGSLAISDPGAQAAALTSWGSQTLGWTANWATNTLGQAGSILSNGALAMVGLDNSILSGSNPWNQAGQQAASFALGSDGPIGTLLGAGNGSQSGSGGSITDPASLASQYGVTVDPTTGQLMTSSMAGDATLSPQFLQSLYGANMSPAALRAISYAQQNAVGQPYSYGGIGPGGYDCSGIASAIYAAARGLPEGQRYFTTESDFQALGFLPGFAPGALNVGIVRGGGGPNSHMALTLPNGVNVESGGASNSTQYGGSAAGAQGFPLQYHLPLDGYESGGPTPSAYGPVDAKGGHLAVVHPNEFMISARGRSRVPDSFLHALNQGIVDPKDLPRFDVGGPVPQAIVPGPPPKPDFTPKVVAPKIVTPAPTPSTPGPAPRVSTGPAPVTVPSTPPPSPQTSQAPYLSPQITTPTNPGAAPSSINHNLPALSKGISSAASAIGQAISTAVGLAAGGASAAGVPGAGAIGAIGPYAAGLATQGGKVVDAAVNVLSSALVGNVPGSMGDPNAPAGGWTLHPDQNRPATATYRGSRGDTNNFYGYTADDVLRQKDNQDALKRQARLAAVPV